jgi:hypothetical protein
MSFRLSITAGMAMEAVRSMEYAKTLKGLAMQEWDLELVDRPIFKRRKTVDRKLAPWQKQAIEKRLQRLEEMPVNLKIQLGFYGQNSKTVPCGFDAFFRDCQNDDGCQRIPTLAVSLPDRATSKDRQKMIALGFQYWEDCDSYYWGFKQESGNAVAWSMFDLIRRILAVQHCWDEEQSIKVYWCCFDRGQVLQKHWPKIASNQSIKYPPLNFDRSRSIAWNRHNRTPYDYEWQSGLRDRDSAKQHWNLLIKKNI